MQVRQPRRGQRAEDRHVRRPGDHDRLRRGSALVWREPPMLARSGIVAAARAWNVMFEAPEIKTASAGGLPGWAGWFPSR